MPRVADFVIQSHPHRVVWAGFETTTFRMQKEGWQLSAEQDLHRMDTVRLMFRHEQAGAFGIAECRDVSRWQSYRLQFGGDSGLTFRALYIQSLRETRIMLNGHIDFRAIDAEPRMTEVKSIDDLRIFAPAVDPSKELIVEPQTVQQLLDQIRQMQAPEQAAIRERQRRERLRAEGQATRVVHAQIISLERAA